MFLSIPENEVRDHTLTKTSDESVSVKKSSFRDGGDGLFSTKRYSVGDVVFLERPLLCLQSIHNRQDVLICGGCQRFIGSFDVQMNMLTRRIPRSTLPDELPVSPTASYDPLTPKLTTPIQIWNCRDKCGEVYCSIQCSELHWKRGHRLMCTGCISEEEARNHPLIQFKQHACATNEIFLLVADVFSAICIEVEKGVSIDFALRPFEGYVRELWWDVVGNTIDRQQNEISSTLKNLVDDSYAHLSKALRLDERGLSEILDVEYFSRTIGMFEQNNVGIRLNSPLRLYCEQLSAADGDDQVKRMLNDSKRILQVVGSESFFDCGEGCDEAEHTQSHENDTLSSTQSDTTTNTLNTVAVDCVNDDMVGNSVHLLNQLKAFLAGQSLDSVFPPLDGTSFYTSICKMNHSCLPNVRIVYVIDSLQGLCARVEVLRTIEAGEELVQSYIDETLPTDERRNALRDYGFVCTCCLCVTSKI